jgi:hypothetical protein
MQCDRCGTDIEQGEEREHLGKTVCEDCYMDILSPARTCDPWAVHSAKSFEQHMGSTVALSPVQSEILKILEETGGVERDQLLDRLKGRVSGSQLEREFATLRHMEKVRAEKRENGRVFLRLW